MQIRFTRTIHWAMLVCINLQKENNLLERRMEKKKRELAWKSNSFLHCSSDQTMNTQLGELFALPQLMNAVFSRFREPLVMVWSMQFTSSYQLVCWASDFETANGESFRNRYRRRLDSKWFSINSLVSFNAMQKLLISISLTCPRMAPPKADTRSVQLYSETNYRAHSLSFCMFFIPSLFNQDSCFMICKLISLPTVSSLLSPLPFPLPPPPSSPRGENKCPKVYDESRRGANKPLSSCFTMKPA